MPLLSAKQRRCRWTVVVCALIALSLPFLKNALPWFPYLPCVFKDFTGLPCVLCGGTRAACAAVRAEWAYSFYLNPLSIPALLALVFVVAVGISENLTGRILIPRVHVAKTVLKIAPLIAVLLIFGWAAHICFAVHKPKPELVDFSKPPAMYLKMHFVKCFKNSSSQIEKSVDQISR